MERCVGTDPVMDIEFKVDETLARFSRHWFTGDAILTVAGQILSLQSVWNPMTHWSVRLTRSWQVEIHGRKVVIEKVRPFLAAGFRPHRYRVFVDDRLIAERCGY
jgi:hypothetical protein